MRWFWQLLFSGRIRRLKRIQYAAALIAQGQTEEAEQILETSRPKRWVEDLAVYHFVRGRLCIETDDLSRAEKHLHTALSLGLDRPSVKLNLAVIRLRQCDLDTALALLEEAALADDPAVLEQAQVMRQVINDVVAGYPQNEINSRADRFRKKHLRKIALAPTATLDALNAKLASHKLSGRDREDASLLYGQLLVEARQGTWLFGLEPRDHRVIIAGRQLQPARLIDQLLDGELDRLSLPDAAPLWPETQK